MDNFTVLHRKLAAFIRRYYLNEILKGAILFVGISILYLMLTLVVEYFLWLNPLGRSILFWAFIGVELVLFARFLVFPLLQLFKISGGLNHEAASQIIGAHFPEVKDKLLNVLQLKKNQGQSDLLMASIDQKAKELTPVPFKLAVNFRKNLPYLKYAAIPVFLFLLLQLVGGNRLFAESYNRVVHYKTPFQPPAPFSFKVMNQSLQTEENQMFTVKVEAIGSLVPENASVHFSGQRYYLKETAPGRFEYTFRPQNENLKFHFSGNEVVSKAYTLEVVKVPRLLNFEMFLNFPAHTGIKDKTQVGSGNATIPEGTEITWKLNTASTKNVAMEIEDSVYNFKQTNAFFSFQKRIIDPLGYTITTSNQKVKNHEKLSYSLKVVKDQFPKLKVAVKKDTLTHESLYFHGNYSDDYGFSRLQLVAFPKNKPDKKLKQNIEIPNRAFGQFFFAFPDSLSLQKGVTYQLYFEIFDNDALHGRKSTKSKVFTFRRKTENERQEKLLEEQNEAIERLSGGLENLKNSEEQLKSLQQIPRQRNPLNYNDRNKLEQFLERQQRQQALMKRYSEKLKNSIEEIDSNEGKDEMGEMLRERLERREGRLQKNEELLEKIQEYVNKISKEELTRELEQLSKSNTNQQKNLAQLLELTKRYYVGEKSQKIANQLEELAKKQEQLSKAGEQNTGLRQDSLNRGFESVRKEIFDLKKENKDLHDPMKLGTDEALEKGIKKEQNAAAEKLKSGKEAKARENQKNAAQKMKELAAKMKKQRASGARMQMKADAGMLRKILDNLVIFSFEQEKLMKKYRNGGSGEFGYAQKLRRQNVLRENFEHIDDSLYALALRNPMLTEKVTHKLTNIDFFLNQALERLSQNKLRFGLSSQQYIISGANDLAYFLSQILGNMKQQLNSSGSQGGDSEMQLPDIIKKQKKLNGEMKQGLQKKKQSEGKIGEGQREALKGELYRIFKEQQKLRRAMEKTMKKMGDGREAQDEMKEIEKDLLKKGFQEETLSKMLQLQHQLLKLKDAKQQQGKENKRESTSNREVFENKEEKRNLRWKKYFNTTEILNRQSLPLRPIYEQKVKEYFEPRRN